VAVAELIMELEQAAVELVCQGELLQVVIV
jgi:hypothetical protein